MSESNDAIQAHDQGAEFDDSLPPGSHALEVAARAGFGPLSPLAQTQWHGQAIPCVSCGQLVRRDDPSCEHCGQDLSEEMVRKMRQHSGPWFVLEHVRPFPGVSLERVIRQIRRGLITETSIVRGPSNDYQWRFAVETPGLCRYFGKCWCCQNAVTLSDAYCTRCLHYLSFEKPRPGVQVPGTAQSTATAPAAGVFPRGGGAVAPSAHGAAAGQSPDIGRLAAQRGALHIPQAEHQPPARTVAAPQSADLARLSAAVRQSRAGQVHGEWDQPQRVGGVNVAWIAGLMIVGTVVALLLISRARSDRPAMQNSPSLPEMQVVPPRTTTAPATPPTQPPTQERNSEAPQSTVESPKSGTPDPAPPATSGTERPPPAP